MSTRSFGKVILAGEHSVVYGKIALATSISLRVSAQVVSEVGDTSELVVKAVEVAGGDQNIQVKIESELPIGSGLGSSAAVSAAAIKAVREYLGKPITNDELFNLVWEVEKFFSPRDSGLDSTVVTYGGLIEYIKGKPFIPLQIAKPFMVLLVNSGQPSETTGELVKMVADNPVSLEIIEEIGRLTEQVRDKLVAGQSVSELLNENVILLERLGVVGESAKKLSSELRELGASVKITGAGGVKTGSGMMIVICNDFAPIKNLLDNRQIDYFEAIIGEQ
jgi:mevalonate kinase